jgi:hypothetical protein
MTKNIAFAPIFIVGSPRSGTTLLSVLMDRHPEVAVSPETDYFRTRKILLPVFRSHQHHVRYVFSHGIFSRIHDLGLSEQAVIKHYKPHRPSYKNLFQALLESYVQKHGKKRGGEKTPMHLDKIPLIFSWYPGAKAICIVRDGRDAALSLQRAGNIHGRDIRALSFIWKRHAVKALRYKERYPDRFFLVHYESLLTNPEFVLERIDKFLDLPFNPSQLDTTIQSEVVTQREHGWKENALKFIDPDKIFRWQREATTDQLIIMESVMRNYLLRFGYPVKTESVSSNDIKSSLYNMLTNCVYRIKTKRFNTGILGFVRKNLKQMKNYGL